MICIRLNVSVCIIPASSSHVISGYGLLINDLYVLSRIGPVFALGTDKFNSFLVLFYKINPARFAFLSFFRNIFVNTSFGIRLVYHIIIVRKSRLYVYMITYLCFRLVQIDGYILYRAILIVSLFQHL